jgi:hypothetical protein
MNTTTIIALVSSLVLNSFLLIYLFGFVPFALFASALLNIGIILYMRFLLSERAKLYQEYGSLLNEMEKFLNHLSQIHELEMFYGDETLEGLISHSKELINIFYDYENQYFDQVTEKTEDKVEQELND